MEKKDCYRPRAGLSEDAGASLAAVVPFHPELQPLYGGGRGAVGPCLWRGSRFMANFALPTLGRQRRRSGAHSPLAAEQKG